MSQSVTTPPPDMAAYVTRDELRADLAELRLEFRTALQGVQGEVGGLRAGIAGLRGSVAAGIAGLRAAIADGRTEAARASVAQLRWLVGTILAAAALAVAALKLLPPQ